MFGQAALAYSSAFFSFSVLPNALTLTLTLTPTTVTLLTVVRSTAGAAHALTPTP